MGQRHEPGPRLLHAFRDHLDLPLRERRHPGQLVNYRSLFRESKPGETPISITKVLYVGGIHGGFLDPAFKGKPQVKTLAQCSICHQKADRGWFGPVTYEISDESFRIEDFDLTTSMPAPSWMRPSKK